MDEFVKDNKEIKGLSIRDLFFKYVRYLPLYIIFVVLALAGAWLYLRYAQERYSSVSSVLLNVSNANKNNSSDKVEDLLANKSKARSIGSEIEILKSKPLLTRVADRLDLDFSYIAKGKIKDANAYGTAPFTLQPLQLNDSLRPFSIELDFVNENVFKIAGLPNSYKFGEVFKTANGQFQLVKQAAAAPEAKYVVNYTPKELVGASLANSIMIAPKGDINSEIVNIGYEADNPYLAADIINTLIDEYNIMSVENSNISMDQTLDFAESNMKTLNGEIDSLNKLLIAFQKDNQIVDARTEVGSFYEESVAQREAIAARKIQVSTLEQIEGYVRNKANTGQTMVPSSFGIEDATLNNLIISFNEIQAERFSLVRANVPVTNPKVQELDDKLENLRRSILESVRTLKASYNRTLALSNNQSSSGKSQALNISPKISEQAEFERQLKQKLDILALFEKRRIEILMSKVGTVSNSKVINKAEPETAPISPKRTQVKLIAVLLGLLVPTAFVFIRELLNDKINTRADIERFTDTPILGEVGHSYGEKTLVVNSTNRSVIAEQFRILRSNLQYIIGQKEKATILVTSSFGGEGKSFVSTNMSAVMALTDKKTVVLEFDLRKPRVLAGLDMSKKPGVSNYMVGNMSLDQLLVPIDGVENLYVLPCGPIPPNPAELLLSDKIKQLFEELRQRFDYIIIDTAPVGMVSDALTLAKYADATLYVSRQGHTYKKQVNLIDDMYSNKKLPHMTIVLNDVRMPTGGGYYGNYGYGYGYGYGEKNSYYEPEVKPKRSIGKKILYYLNPLNWFNPKGY